MENEKVYEVNQSLEDYVIEIRRQIHRFPEISGNEVKTIKIITSELEKMGIHYEVIENGGVIGFIEGAKPGKTIILRADIDALPMQEDPNNAKGSKLVVSEIKNVAHTCGHDGHTAMLLGAAKQLSEFKNQFRGRVLLAFEQGEEDGRGIYKMVKRLNEIGADGIWGMHIKPDIPSQKISVDEGPRTASLFIFKVILKGVGGHGSRPDLAISPLDAFTDFYQQLKNMKANALSPFEPITFSVGSVNTGFSQNIIDEVLEFSGTFRFLHYHQGKEAEQEFKRLLKLTCEIHNCEFEYLIEPKATDISINNHKTCAELAKQAITEAVGEDAVYPYPAWMASETFAFYQKYFPGVFAFLGTQNKDKGIGADNHHPQFDIDENILKVGVASTVNYALLFLKNESNILFNPTTKEVKDLILNAGLKLYS